MSDNKKLCPRCRGRKSVFRIGKSGYTLENFGGEQIDCPTCNGEGRIEIPDFVQAAKENEEALREIKVERKKKKELMKDAESEESTGQA